MTGLLILFAAAFTGFGCYHLSCAFVDVPTAQTSRMMMLAKKQTGTSNEKLFDVYLTKIAAKLSPLLKLDPIKRSRISLTLDIAGIPLTPECYTMKAFLTAAATGLLGVPFFMVMPLMGLLIMGLAVMVWFSTYYKAFDLVKKRRRLIEAELHPAGARHGQGCLKTPDLLPPHCRAASGAGTGYHRGGHADGQLRKCPAPLPEPGGQHHALGHRARADRDAAGR